MSHAPSKGSEPKFVMPTNNLNFKRLFASPKHIHISEGFLTDLAEYDPMGWLKITSLQIETPYSIVDANQLLADQGHDQLSTEVDYACVDENGDRFVIEMQKQDQTYLEQRIAYNVGQKYAQYYAGEDEIVKYDSLRPVVSITILVENHFKNDDIAVRFMRPHDARHDVYKNNLNLGLEIYVEISKDISDLPKNLQAWIMYFRTGGVSECAPCYIKEAADMSKISSFSKEERRRLYLIEQNKQIRLDVDQTMKDKAAADERAKVTAEMEAKAEAEKLEIARNFLANNVPIEIVATSTGLPIEQIQELAISVKE